MDFRRGAPLRAPVERHHKTLGLTGKKRVLAGQQEVTAGGLKKDDLRTNKHGRVVGKAASDSSVRRYEGSRLQLWNQAQAQARAELGIEGFVKMGRGPGGIALLNRIRAIYHALKCALAEDVD